MIDLGLKDYLDQKVAQFNQPAFVEDDPVQLIHAYNSRPDIEIVGLWTAILSWGQRTTIINKAKALFNLMGKSPFEFIVNHLPGDRKRFESFKHRTFQYTDTLYFLEFLQWYFRQYDTLELAFIDPKSGELEQGLIHFEELFFSLPTVPSRTRKHVATPAKRSSCKRINMFLRWMVRQDKCGVDLGLWRMLQPSQLFIPLDVHVEKIAKRLNLLQRKQRDWLAVKELTSVLRKLDPDDPTRYDFALFGIGIEDKYAPIYG